MFLSAVKAKLSEKETQKCVKESGTVLLKSKRLKSEREKLTEPRRTGASAQKKQQ